MSKFKDVITGEINDTEFNSLSPKEKDAIVNAGTGRKLNEYERAWKTRNWPKGNGEDFFRTNNGYGSNIPCGFDNEGYPSNTCNC